MPVRMNTADDMMAPSKTAIGETPGSPPAKRRGMAWLVVFPAAFLLVVFFLIPMFVALRYSLLSTMPFFDPNPFYTLANYIRVLTEPIYLRSFVRTAGYAVTASVISLLISYPVAYYLACRARRGALILIVMLIPFWTSIILRVFSWKIILGSSGIINSLLTATGGSARGRGGPLPPPLPRPPGRRPRRTRATSRSHPVRDGSRGGSCCGDG